RGCFFKPSMYCFPVRTGTSPPLRNVELGCYRPSLWIATRGKIMLWTDLAKGEFSIGYVDVNGIRTRCLSAGSGGDYPLILLHGSGGHLEAYQRNILPHAEHMRVFAIDMLGHGFTDKPDHDYEIDHYVDHVMAFCDTLGLAKVFISGESLGGWVAARLAIRFPERVVKLVL